MRITSNYEKTDKLLRAFSSKVQDISPVLKEFAEIYKDEIKTNFDKEGLLTNFAKWEQLKEPYKTRKEKTFPGAKILQRSGKLLNAATGGNNYSQSIGKMSLEMKVDLVYANTMQFGSSKRNIAARPFFFTKDGKMPARATVELLRMLNRYVEAGNE